MTKHMLNLSPRATMRYKLYKDKYGLPNINKVVEDLLMKVDMTEWEELV